MPKNNRRSRLMGRMTHIALAMLYGTLFYLLIGCQPAPTATLVPASPLPPTPEIRPHLPRCLCPQRQPCPPLLPLSCPPLYPHTRLPRNLCGVFCLRVAHVLRRYLIDCHHLIPYQVITILFTVTVRVNAAFE